MTISTGSSLSRIRLVAFAGALFGSALVLIAAWMLLHGDVEPGLGALALPALAGPILHPRFSPSLFVRYMCVGMVASTGAIVLGLISGRI